MRNAVDELGRVSLALTGYRLIPSRFPPISIYEGLVANDRIPSLVEIEDLTNPRLRAAHRVNDIEAAQQPDRLQNWNHAPFAYSNPEGSLFFGSDRPCLELAADKQTALAVSISRRERFLARTNEPAVGLDMRLLCHPVSGVFVDLRPLGSKLDNDQRRALGEGVSGDVDGVVYFAAERPNGFCVAVLKGSALGRSVQASHYRYVWNGVRMQSLYAFDEAGRKLTPEEIAGTTDVLAA